MADVTPFDPAPSDSTARVTLITRTNCHLCGPARRVLAAECGAAGERFTEVSVDSDAELREAYGDQVPVVLVDGEQIAALVVEPGSIQRALARPV